MTDPSSSSHDELSLDEPRGWRHNPTWLYLVMLISSAVALGVSFILAAETLQMARHPDQLLSCDVNARLSCTAVAQSWQSEILHVGELSFPNAFFGIAAESVFVTIAVIGLARVKLPRWFAAATWWGSLAALAYSYWLTSQSLFVINALCPWCLVLFFATTIQFMSVSHATVTVQHIPAHARGLRTYYRLNYDLMIDVVWIVALVALIIIKDGAYLFNSYTSAGTVTYHNHLHTCKGCIRFTVATNCAPPVSNTSLSVTSTRSTPPLTVICQ